MIKYSDSKDTRLEKVNFCSIFLTKWKWKFVQMTIFNDMVGLQEGIKVLHEDN